MKTILAIFTNVIVTDSTELAKAKKYSYNTESDIKVGDMIKSQNYTKPVQIVEILEDTFEWYNPKTGSMSNERESEDFFNIRQLELCEEEDLTIYGIKIN
jgi:hypothetical protein